MRIPGSLASGSRPSRGFGGPDVWPVDGSALAAMADLGMSDQQIANYFDVAIAVVRERLDCVLYRAPATRVIACRDGWI